MTYSNYLTIIAVITKGLIKKKVVALHHCSCNLKFSKHLLRSPFWENISDKIVISEFQNDIGSNDDVLKVVLLSSFNATQKLGFCPTGVFQESSLIVVFCIFGKLKIRTLTPNRSKYQINDIFKLLGHNYSHQKEFVKPRNCCSPLLQF